MTASELIVAIVAVVLAVIVVHTTYHYNGRESSWVIQLENGKTVKRGTYLQILYHSDHDSNGMLDENESLTFAYLLCHRGTALAGEIDLQTVSMIPSNVKRRYQRAINAAFKDDGNDIDNQHQQYLKENGSSYKDIPISRLANPSEIMAQDHYILSEALRMITHEGSLFCAAYIGSFLFNTVYNMDH